MSEVTRILKAIDGGDPQAAAELLPLVYDEWRLLAAKRLAIEKPGQTLQATALVHEAYLRLVGVGPGPHWDHRGPLFAAAAEAMRRMLVAAARRKQAICNGGGKRRVALEDYHRITQSPDGLLAFDDVLTRFASSEPAKAELVQLRFFAGLSTPAAASALGISVATAKRWWVFARAWLLSELRNDAGQDIFPTVFDLCCRARVRTPLPRSRLAVSRAPPRRWSQRYISFSKAHCFGVSVPLVHGL